MMIRGCDFQILHKIDFVTKKISKNFSEEQNWK